MIKVFEYIPELDAFRFTTEFEIISYKLGLGDWHPGVWLGRLFARNQDFGEHFADQFEARELLEEKLGCDAEELVIVVPDAFTETSKDADGPVYGKNVVKLFWTEVFKSLEFSEEALAKIALNVHHEDQIKRRRVAKRHNE